MKSIRIQTLIAVAMTLSACGRKPHLYSVTPELQSFVSEFAQTGEAYGVQVPLNNLIVEFSEVDLEPGNPHIIGLCTLDATPRIQISRKWWDFQVEKWKGKAVSPELPRKIVMFHELGHCLLGREHRGDRSPEGEPLSIMYSSNFIPSSKVPLEAFYRELFTNPDLPSLDLIFQPLFSGEVK
jgi:hypothetical protein